MLWAILLFTFASVIGSPQDAPVFRADSQLVQINVIVRDKDGPVSNLSKGDFVLTDQGKTRAIDFFSPVQALRLAPTGKPLRYLHIPFLIAPDTRRMLPPASR